MKKLLILVFAAAILGCNFTGTSTAPASASTGKFTPPVLKSGPLDTATFASGCFWCVEAIFERLKGVKEAVSGYSGGHTKNPTYEQVCSHTTGHTETVQVYYDPEIISYQSLLEVYFASQDPTQVEGQGPDHGDSYRSVIFYHNTKEQIQAETYKKQLNESGKYKAPIAVIIQPFMIFYKAEDYHQNFEADHPDHPYVARVSVPRIHKMEKQFPQLLKQ